VNPRHEIEQKNKSHTTNKRTTRHRETNDMIIRCDQLKNKSSRRVTYGNPCYSIGSKANSIYFLNDHSVLTATVYGISKTPKNHPQTMAHHNLF
jgi:hypothetical protein